MLMRSCVLLVLLAGCNWQLALAELFTAEHLVKLDRVGAPALSPDGEQVVYAVRKTDMEAGKGRYDLWLSPVAGGTPRQLTRHEASDNDPAWSADGESIYFLSTRSGASQVWRIDLGGGEAVQVSNLPLDVGTFRVTADGKTLVVSLQTYIDCDDLACTVAKDEELAEQPTSGVIYAQLFMRHWDHWLNEKRSRLFAVPLEDGIATPAEPVLLTASVDADVPSRVWGGKEEYALSADGKTVYFTARLRDAMEPYSTNYDIYSAAMNGNGQASNLTESNPAWDTQPLLSPDGKYLAYLAMSRPGFEADRYRIMLRNLENGETRELAPHWDRSPSSIAFSRDGALVYANAQDMGNKTLWRFDLKTGDAERIVAEGTVSAFEIAADHIVYAADSLKSPSELFVLDRKGSRQITHFSAPQLEGVTMAEFEQFSFAGAGGETVYGYVMKPAVFEQGKQYPIAFLVHGGPQGSFDNHFHYRWNPQTYAGQGFAAVFIDFHGSTGYGQAFTDSISGDWGGAPLKDLQLGLAAAIEKYDFLDGEKACALGASYGGYMINWIAGNWPDRFNCLVNHDGTFDSRMMYYTTEELWFPEWENGGPHYARPEEYEKFNPVNHVQNWQTPMLVIHGELDYRLPVTQGIATFTALQRRSIPSKFLYYPDENHWVLNPHNSIQWHREVNQWLHEHMSSSMPGEEKK
ncbi:MAG: S9 family peptidase [Xanthomonadales bacterium]|nr:S9 family peptidase [Xanthomonadales bacterium]